MPELTVIIPAYHSDQTIGGCLDALGRQTFRDFEVVVVDSSPGAVTEGIVRHRYPDARFEQSPSRLLPHAARNRGVACAQGRHLVFTDPDCRANGDWLEKLVGAMRQGPGMVGGSIDTVSKGWLASGVHLCKFPEQMTGLGAGAHAVLPTANLLIRREIFEAIGPFDEDVFCGDTLLCRRAKAAGITLRFEPRAIVSHVGTPHLRPFMQERMFRGAEFARERMRLEQWSPMRSTLHAAAMPARLLWLLTKTAAHAVRGGRAGTFISTLPLQIIGQALWLLGEARSQIGGRT